jgi:hypothetical protein
MNFPAGERRGAALRVPRSTLAALLRLNQGHSQFGLKQRRSHDKEKTMNPKTTRIGRLITLAVFAALSLLLTASPGAQEARGTISGKVRDASDAVIPGVSVTITNTAMGTSVTVTSNDAGLFRAPFLLPGTYRIAAEGQGFKRYVRDGVTLQVNDTIELDVQLEVGGLGETVTVTADAAALETTTASMGQVVDQRRIAELPIAHGDPFKLIGLAGGVSYTGSQRLDRPFEPTHVVGYAMDGTRGNRSDITIDGVPSTATANANEVIASFVPPQDLVAEFKVQTATFDAQFGNTEGGVTNLSIKSGTNNFHGTAYYTKMAPGLFANDFFANANRIARPDFTYNRFGGTVGGPVRIPKVYNGQNKTFFMFGYEGIIESRPRNNGTPTVPTEKMKQGDFSDLLALGPQYRIFNPFTRRAVAGGRFEQDPFPGNVIPANLINPVARKIVDQFFPKPLTAGNPDGTNNYQNPSLPEDIKYHSNTIRVDHVINDKQRIFGRGSWYNRDSNYNNYFGNIATGEWFIFKSRQGTFDHVYTISPTTVLNTRYGYNRFIRGTNSNPGNRGLDLTTLGFPASYNNLIPEDVRRFPRFDIAGYQGTGVGGELRPNDTHSFNATVNKALNTHSVKFGTEFRSYRETDKFFANNQTGQFNFDSTWTRGPLDNSPTAPGQLGQSFAAFLLGLPTSGSVNQPADYAEQSTTWGFFIHDDWRVNDRLTLNIGLRYELEGALSERYNRSVTGFDFAAVQPMEAAARTAYARNPTPEVPAAQFNVRGGLLFAPDGESGSPLYEVPKKNFMPRFGFAYKLDDKTVVRGGYGIFYGFLGQRRGDVNQIGFSTNTPLNVTLDNGLTFRETLSNPFPNGLAVPKGAADGIQTFLGQNISFFNQRPLSPYMQRWQLGVQRELAGGLIVEAAYVGNRGTHIEVTRNINALPNQYLSTSATRDQAQIDYLSRNVANPFVGLMPANAGTAFRSANIGRSQLLRPYPHFGDINTTTNEGYSWYHSLQTNVQKRFSRGYTFGASYTFSKFMEAIELLNAGDARPTEVVSPADRPHRLTVNGIYEFPFGKGRRLLADTHGFVSRLISGWQVSGIYTFQSGAPIGFGNVIYNGDVRDIALSGDRQTVGQWFNTAGFVALRDDSRTGTPVVLVNGQPQWVDFNDPKKNKGLTGGAVILTNPVGFNRDASYQLASNVRTFPLRFGFIRADQINNFDFSFIKNTEIAEGKNLQFRAEFLNAFNHPFFPGPNVTPTQTAFGQIAASTQDNYARRIQLTARFIF